MTDDKHGSPRGLDSLNTRALHQKREYVRDLAERGDPQSLALLVECLCDESWYTRDLAEEALVKLGAPGADLVLPLVPQGLWFTRTSIARILGRCVHRPGVPALLELSEDGNRTVAEAAREALIAIAKGGGAANLAHALHRLPSDRRRARLEEIARRDRGLMDRIERLARSEEIMSSVDADSLSDESPVVRAAEEGVEWEVLTGPPPPKKEGDEEGGSR